MTDMFPTRFEAIAIVNSTLKVVSIVDKGRSKGGCYDILNFAIYASYRFDQLFTFDSFP